MNTFAEVSFINEDLLYKKALHIESQIPESFTKPTMCSTQNEISADHINYKC